MIVDWFLILPIINRQSTIINPYFMYDKIIEIGIMVLLVYTPLAFGGVTQRSITVLEMMSGVLLVVWLAKVLSQHKNVPPKRLFQANSRISFTKVLFAVLMGVFLACILLQFFPLPRFLVNIISPATYRLYAEGALQTGSTLPSLLSFSVCNQATEVEFYKLLAYATVFFLIINTIRSSKQVKRLVYVILAVGLLESLYGLIQFVAGQHLIFSYKKSAFWVNGTFVNRNHFAGYMEMVIPLALGVLFTRFEKQTSSRLVLSVDSIREKYPKAFLLLLGVLIMIFALLLSGSRGGIISFSLGMIFFALIAHTRRLLRRWVSILLIFLPIAIGITVIVGQDMLIQRLSTLTELESDLSFRERWEFWKAAEHIFEDFPMLGSGFGTFSHLSPKYWTFRTQLRHFRYAENDYVQLLAETGIIGTALMVLAGFMFFYYTFFVWKRRHSRWAVAMVAGGLSALFSIIIHSWTDFNLRIPSNALLFSVIAALSYVIARSQKAGGRRQKAEGRRQKAEGRSSETHSNQYSVSSNQYSVSSHPHPAPCPSHLAPRIQRFSRYLVILSIVVVFVYLFRVAESYYAFVHYQDVAGEVPPEKASSFDATRHEYVTSRLKTAIRHDSNNAEYAFALGSYLYRYHADTQDPEFIAHKSQRFQEAEQWLHKAIMLDPANPWYYYEMGRLSNSRGDCLSSSPSPNPSHQGRGIDSSLPWWEEELKEQDCPTARYFLAALHNAPNEMFLRKEIGLWYYYYDQEAAYRLLRERISRDATHTPERPRISRQFSKFLYDIRMDYESDRELRRALPAEKEERDQCQATRVLQQSSDNQEIEFGHDDGSAEWRIRLTSETDRVKKVICLPENLDEYTDAALKVSMNHGGSSNFTAQISINDQRIKTYDQTVPRIGKWYEIPFEKTLLDEKSRITVYIRVTNASEAGNYLQIWGDQDTPTTSSVFNIGTTDDLSPDEGIQTGEYMIRLVLRKL